MKLISFASISIYLLTVNVTYAQRCDQFYTIKSGDTLSTIAFQFYADRQRWRLIKDANSSSGSINEINMPVGMQLYIPCTDGDKSTRKTATKEASDKSVLEALLADGITQQSNHPGNKVQPADNQDGLDVGVAVDGDAVQNSSGQKNSGQEKIGANENASAKTGFAVSSDTDALLKELLGENIVNKETPGNGY